MCCMHKILMPEVYFTEEHAGSIPNTHFYVFIVTGTNINPYSHLSPLTMWLKH